MSAIDRAAPIPLHAQLKQILMEQIACGVWEAGTRIPSEKQVETAYGLSRITVRHALSTLVWEGVLVRVRGHGSFVAQSKLTYHLSGDMDLHNPIRQERTEVEIRLVDSQWMVATLPVAHALNVPLHSRVFCIQRLQMVGGERIAYSYAYVPQVCAQRIKVEGLADEDSLAYLRHLLPVGPLPLERTFEAHLAGEREARLLGIVPGKPILHLERIVFSKTHQPIEYLNAVFVGERIKYRMT